jgi:alpha-methylacyl-CoA racemase
MAYAGLAEAVIPTLQADVIGGINAALGMLAGVTRGRATGEPSHVDLALADAALTLGGVQTAEPLGTEVLGRPVVSLLDGRRPCYQVYRCADGRLVSFGAIEFNFWANAMAAIHRPERSDRTWTRRWFRSSPR